jgi:hypothetical protein
MNRTSLMAICLLGAATVTSPVVGQGTPQSVTIFRVDPVGVASGYRASKVIGANVVNDRGDGIGKIDDVIISSDGKAPYAVLSVGGFLGVGSRLVLVRYQDLNFANNKVTLAGASKEQLMALPEFKYAN